MKLFATTIVKKLHELPDRDELLGVSALKAELKELAFYLNDDCPSKIGRHLLQGTAMELSQD